MKKEELDKILELHKEWLCDSSKGKRADLHGANLRDADLCGADLRGADLRGAHLRGADLCYADLRGEDLRGADLRGAHLRGADLRGADLRGADLHNANFRGANLEGANFDNNNNTEKKLSEVPLKYELQIGDVVKFNLVYNRYDEIAEIIENDKGKFIKTKLGFMFPIDDILYRLVKDE